MPRYNKNSVKELKAFLYNSYIHDANLENFEYNCKEDHIKIKLVNPIFGVQIDLIFLNIGLALVTKGDWPGDRTTVLSLNMEEDFSYLQNHQLLKQSKYTKDDLYFLVQMFSGDELHIVSKEVIAEVIE